MTKELAESIVLAVYDVRGIQKYIFASNEIKNIVGASNLVEDIIIQGLNAWILKNKEWNQEHFMTDWMNDDPEAFEQNDQIQMQVMFIGGGNAYVLFRKGSVCEKANRFLGKYVLEKTYSLNLAIAVIPKSNSYKKDYEAINQKNREIKSIMPKGRPMGAFPFMAVDSVTGYPLTSKVSYKEGEKYLSTESKLKRDCLPQNEDAEKILDNMVTKKGDNSTLAVVHIDGNSMGNRIKNIMSVIDDYGQAIKTMRSISKNIKQGFEHAFSDMAVYIDKVTKKVKPDISEDCKLYRKIILAGDDITFICNTKVAMAAVEVFLKEISKYMLYEEPDKSEFENKKLYGFSACAGIAYFNSHFPFSDAYEVAESCCANAKKYAKKGTHREEEKADGRVGCFIDYQICINKNSTDLSTYREKNYRYSDQDELFIDRPYYVACDAFETESTGCLNTLNEGKSIRILWNNLTIFNPASDDRKRSKYKQLRNSFALSSEEVEKQVSFLKSRNIVLPNTSKDTWYDALELMDICEIGEDQNEAKD